MPVIYDKFSRLLYRKFIDEGLYGIKEISDKMNVPGPTFYNYVEGKSHFPIELLAPLYNITGDIDVINFTLNDTDQRAVPKEAVASNGSVMDETFDAVAAHGELVQAIHEAIKDRCISEIEAKSIEAKINKASKELEELRVAIKQNDMGGQA